MSWFVCINKSTHLELTWSHRVVLLCVYVCVCVCMFFDYLWGGRLIIVDLFINTKSTHVCRLRILCISTHASSRWLGAKSTWSSQLGSSRCSERRLDVRPWPLLYRFVCVVVGGGANVHDSVAGGCESVATGYTLFLFGSYFFGWLLDWGRDCWSSLDNDRAWKPWKAGPHLTLSSPLELLCF